MMVGVAHDLIEDTHWNAGMLLAEGFHPDVVEDIVVMSHIKDESYEKYIIRIGKHPRVIPIKLEDLKHNMDPTRLPLEEGVALSPKVAERMGKYLHAYRYLENILNETNVD